MRALAAGLDIGGTKILGHVLDGDDLSGSLAQVRVDTPRGAPAIEQAAREVLAMLARQVGGRFDTIGIGVAGLVDLEGVLRFAPNLPGAIDIAVAPALREEWKVPVLVDNDANTAMWAEYRMGAAIGVTESVLVTLGTGIGAGIIVGGRLQRGAAGFGGEPGHMVVDPSGPPCPCGRRGCWERFASGSGLGRLARDAAEAGQADRVVTLAGGDAEDVRGEHVTRAALEGDPDAVAVLRQFAWWVALGVANLVNILDPELVVIGGGLADAGELLLAPTRQAYAGLVLAHEHRSPVRVEAASLGADAGAVGAAVLALDSL
ncbi:MAG: ROK family protein [Actinobacteria bacterium]|nr:ROK family protein [Actinomycetota bacterium]